MWNKGIQDSSCWVRTRVNKFSVLCPLNLQSASKKKTEASTQDRKEKTNQLTKQKLKLNTNETSHYRLLNSMSQTKYSFLILQRW